MAVVSTGTNVRETPLLPTPFLETLHLTFGQAEWGRSSLSPTKTLTTLSLVKRLISNAKTCPSQLHLHVFFSLKQSQQSHSRAYSSPRVSIVYCVRHIRQKIDARDQECSSRSLFVFSLCVLNDTTTGHLRYQECAKMNYYSEYESL